MTLCRYPTSNRFRALLYSLLVITLMIFIQPRSSSSWANGLVEVQGGFVNPTGGELESEIGLGFQLNAGWGGRAKWFPEGAAVYGYTGLSFDRIKQKGSALLGEIPLVRDQTAWLFGVRFYYPLAERVRLWVETGSGYIWEESETTLLKGIISELQTSDWMLHGGLGVQVKLIPRLLLTLGVQQVIYIDSEQMSIAERPLTESGGQSMGRYRISAGFGWTL